MDITYAPEIKTAPNFTFVKAVYPTEIKYQTAVKALLPSLNKTLVQSNLERLSSFHNRYYNSTYGQQSSEWLQGIIGGVLKASGAKNATVVTVKHPWLQSSIVVKIPGKSSNVVVVGAHQDSINGKEPMTGRAPGADDNGSGTVTILEALRVLLQDPNIAQGKAENTLEFHWYAGEEGGLLGSQSIYNTYWSTGVNVRAFLNQDMTGWNPPSAPERFGLVTDHVDTALTTYITRVIQEVCRAYFVFEYWFANKLLSTARFLSSRPRVAMGAPTTLRPTRWAIRQHLFSRAPWMCITSLSTRQTISSPVCRSII